MKYFGTDGIRGIVGEGLNKNIILKIANGIVGFFKKHKLPKLLLVGNDTRASSDYILSLIAGKLLACGIQIDNLGECSSPCLAFLTKKFNYPLGMMISASHNPQEFNGIKFFNTAGEKISEQTEDELESFMDKHHRTKLEFAKLKNKENLKQTYVNHLRQHQLFDVPCLFDCAFGGTSQICHSVFGKNKIFNAQPNGQNINLNCGCTHIEMLRARCIAEHKIGFAFDGDGDRVLAVSATGEVVDGDKILFALAKHYLAKGDCLVGTIYTNTGLEIALKKFGINLIRAQVGDKNVYAKMSEHSALLGGENSGHIIIKKFANTGDGILTAICLTNLLKNEADFENLFKGYVAHHQATANIKLKQNFVLTNEIKTLIEQSEKTGTRIIVRPSGTEPVLRIMVEDKNKETTEKILQLLKNQIEKL